MDLFICGIMLRETILIGVHRYFHKLNQENGNTEEDQNSKLRVIFRYLERSQVVQLDFPMFIFFKEIPENGADVSHLNVVHRPAMMMGGKPKDAVFQWGFLKHVWSASWAANNQPGEEYKALMKVHHHLSIFNKISLMSMDVEAHQVTKK